MKNVKSIIAALSLSAMFGISSANATPVTFKFDGFETAPAKTVNYTRTDDTGTTTGNVYSGMYELTFNDGPDWLTDNNPILAFCVELEQNIKINTTYSSFDLVEANEVLDDVSVTSINRLLSSLDDFDFTDSESAILQASIWELVYDNVLPGNLNDGAFKVNSSTAEGVLNQYLAAAKVYTGALKYELFVLKDANRQDLLVWREVSAPSTIALFLVMAGLVMLRRQKA